MQYDKEGMYPAHPCKVCGKPLNADGGHPAELYAGSYTGECYVCQKAPRYIVKTFSDGAILYSYPPDYSPRRERLEVHAYADCQECKGEGRILHERSYPQGGPYYASCQACFHRFWYYLPRKARLDYIQDRRKLLREAAESMWSKELAKLYTEKQLKQMIKDKFDFRTLAPLAESIRKKYYRIDARWEAMIARRYTDNLL